MRKRGNTVKSIRSKNPNIILEKEKESSSSEMEPQTSPLNTQTQNNEINNKEEEDMMNIQDFYEIDFYDFEIRNKKFMEEKRESELKKKKKVNKATIVNNIGDKVFGRRINDFNDFQNYINKLKVKKLKKEEFIIDNFLYQHRDTILKGKILSNSNNNNNNKVDEVDSFIKCYNLNNIIEMNEIVKEISIYKILHKQKKKYLCKMLAYYIDVENNCFYLFYEYFEKSLIEALKSISTQNKIVNNSFSIDSELSSSQDQTINKTKSFIQTNEKYEIFKQFLEFLLILHSNGTIHRDLALKYFYYDEAYSCIKTFDLSNAFSIKEGIFLTSEKIDKNFLKQLKDSLYYDGIFYTPLHLAPEISAENPMLGYYQDIWSFGCLMIEFFLDYNKYDEKSIEITLMKSFQGEQFNNTKKKANGDIVIKNIIPLIPKIISKRLAKIILSCLEPNYFERITTDRIINKFNIFFKDEHLDTLVKISEVEKFYLSNMIEIYNKLYKLYETEPGYKIPQLMKDESKIFFMECPAHQNKIRNIYCEKCHVVLCQTEYNEEHQEHKMIVLGDNKKGKRKTPNFIDDKNKLREIQLNIEKLEMNRSYIDIKQMNKQFYEDYEIEKAKIPKLYKELREKIKNIRDIQLDKLEKSKRNFLETKFQKYFEMSDKLSIYCQQFYQTKDNFLSNLNRINFSLEKDEINESNFQYFKKKFDQFKVYTDNFQKSSIKLKNKCESFKIPGSYIFQKEKHSENIIKLFDSTLTKIKTKKNKFFDYSTKELLFLENEIILIIPFTKDIYSYNKNMFKKINIYFEKNKIDIDYFLPGCATVHQNDLLLITGGEYKDSSTSIFMILDIPTKKLIESVDMNFTRRFHSMLSMSYNEKNFICVLGGWDSKEVELLETTDNKYKTWMILPSMNYQRSDASTFFMNEKYIYVFGGWDYETKHNLDIIERYEVFSDGVIKLSKAWEKINVKGDLNLIKKYNMGLIDLNPKKNNKEKEHSILLVGGYDTNFDYSFDVIKANINIGINEVKIEKFSVGLPPGMECSFWYEKSFINAYNEYDKEEVSVNFNCFNNIYVYSFKNKNFKQFQNTISKL